MGEVKREEEGGCMRVCVCVCAVYVAVHVCMCVVVCGMGMCKASSDIRKSIKRSSRRRGAAATDRGCIVHSTHAMRRCAEQRES